MTSPSSSSFYHALGYTFSFFYIYSLIHPVLEKVSPSSHLHKVRHFISILFHTICIFLISFNLFLLFIYYRSTAVTSRCILPGVNPFSRRRNFCLFSNLLYTPYLSFHKPGGSCFTKRNIPCRNTLLNTLRHYTCTFPRPIMFLDCFFIATLHYSWLGNNSRCSFCSGLASVFQHHDGI
jgi:hypothetical protein